MELEADQMDSIGELERVMREAEEAERDQGDDVGEPEKTSHTQTGDDLEGYKAMARDAFALIGSAASFIEPRVQQPEEVLIAAGENVGPVLAKHEIGAGVAEGGSGLPLMAEIRAGFFIGSYLKALIGQIRALWAEDKKQQESDSNADQRGHESEEQTHAVPGEVGTRQESVPQTAEWLTVPDQGG